MQVLFLHGVGEAGRAGSQGPAKPALPISAGPNLVYIDSTEINPTVIVTAFIVIIRSPVFCCLMKI